jgi:RNA polymerase sigma factor (sigma-70 family)
VSIQDGALNESAPWIIRIATARKVLTHSEEYELIKLARPSIKAQRILNKKKNQAALARHPEVAERLKVIGEAGMAAQKKLLEHNYRLIISVAKKHYGRGLAWEDMIQHGSEGFLYAVSRFDVNTKNKLSTYASQWIRQRISRAIENTGRIIRIPIHMQAKINEIKYIYRKHVQVFQEKPSSEEIATLYNLNPRKKKNFKPITKEEAEELGRHLHDITSLDESAGDDENLSVLHYVRDEGAGLEDTTEVSGDKSYLLGLMKDLPEQDQHFLKFKYGLVDGVMKSDIRTAEVFQCTIKEVREWEKRVLNVLTLKADPYKTSIDLEQESFGLILLHAPEGLIPTLEQEFMVKIPSLPRRIYSSTDKDQIVLLDRRLRSLGCRVEILSSF